MKQTLISHNTTRKSWKTSSRDHGQEETIALPRIKPGIDIPDLEYSDSILLAGDFLHYLSFESASAAGLSAAYRIEVKTNTEEE